MIGQILGRKYEIIRLIGQGGMGVVYEARNMGTGRRVAIKMISVMVPPRDDSYFIRFRREARAAAAIESQYIVQVFDVDEDPATGAPFIVMELLRGEDMQLLINRCGPLSLQVALRIVGQACIGLQAAHEAGVIHRDVKPSNLFLARSDERQLVSKLLDFGLAKILTKETRTGSVVGTLAYMAPEQVKDEVVDARTDVFALGGTLYCALTGEPPVKGQHMVAIISDLLFGAPTPLAQVAPWVPPEVANIVMRALQRHPADRFPSAAAMLDALRSVIGADLTLREDMLPPLRAPGHSGAEGEAGAADAGRNLVDPLATTQAGPDPDR